jgi:hypothetical protein
MESIETRRVEWSLRTASVGHSRAASRASVAVAAGRSRFIAEHYAACRKLTAWPRGTPVGGESRPNELPHLVEEAARESRGEPVAGSHRYACDCVAGARDGPGARRLAMDAALRRRICWRTHAMTACGANGAAARRSTILAIAWSFRKLARLASYPSPQLPRRSRRSRRTGPAPVRLQAKRQAPRRTRPTAAMTSAN